MILTVHGRQFEIVRVQIEDLPEFRRRRGVVPLERVSLGDGDDWPPMVLYGPPPEEERDGPDDV